VKRHDAVWSVLTYCPPSNSLVRMLLGDFGVPLPLLSADVRDPVKMGVILLFDPFDALHEGGKRFELCPLVLRSGDGHVDLDRLFDCLHDPSDQIRPHVRLFRNLAHPQSRRACSRRPGAPRCLRGGGVCNDTPMASDDEIWRRRRARETRAAVQRALERAEAVQARAERLSLESRQLHSKSARTRARSFEIRFPDGDYEIDVTTRPLPAAGATMRRKHANWRVGRVEAGRIPVVYVEHVA